MPWAKTGGADVERVNALLAKNNNGGVLGF
jgi:hypothetical protein